MQHLTILTENLLLTLYFSVSGTRASNYIQTIQVSMILWYALWFLCHPVDIQSENCEIITGGKQY